MTTPSFEHIEFSVENAVATIRLNRPAAANGMTLPSTRELLQVATLCDGDAGIRAVILTGNGLETQMELEGRAIAAQSASPDGQEGIAAFLEKRAPNFTGA